MSELYIIGVNDNYKKTILKISKLEVFIDLLNRDESKRTEEEYNF